MSGPIKPQDDVELEDFSNTGTQVEDEDEDEELDQEQIVNPETEAEESSKWKQWLRQAAITAGGALLGALAGAALFGIINTITSGAFTPALPVVLPLLVGYGALLGAINADTLFEVIKQGFNFLAKMFGVEGENNLEINSTARIAQELMDNPSITPGETPSITPTIQHKEAPTPPVSPTTTNPEPPTPAGTPNTQHDAPISEHTATSGAEGPGMTI